MTDKKTTFDDRLKNHPDLKARFERILDIAESKILGPDTADEVEERTIIEVRKLGQEIMQDWASNKVAKSATRHKEAHPKSAQHKKKRPIGIQPLEKSE